MKKNFYGMLWILGLMSALSLEGVSAMQMYLEAEDFDDVLRCPCDNEDAAGWYGREWNVRAGAPGRCFVAAIHENCPESGRTMSVRLDEPVPAGKYRAFLRVIGPKTALGMTHVSMGLGDRSAEFEWEKGPRGGRKFGWLPPIDIELKKPADSISLTARKFGGKGWGGLYEPMHNTIWIDTVYLTDDLKEETPPDLQTEKAVRAGIDPASLPERPDYALDETGPNEPVTPRPEAVMETAPILLKSYDGRKNMWPGSSFELGMNDGWVGGAIRGLTVLTDQYLDGDDPVDGTFSLHVPAMVGPFSRPYLLQKGGEMTLSAYVRGTGTVDMVLKKVKDVGKETFKLKKVVNEKALSKKAELTPEWQRLSVTGKLEPGWYFVCFLNKGDMWVDAIQLEEGAQATDYAPRAAMECGVRSGRLANIVYEDEQDALDVWFHNSGSAPVKATASYRILDVRDRTVAEGKTEPVNVPGGKTVKVPAIKLPELRGIFSVLYSVDGRKGPEGELVYMVMPKPADKPTRHQLGGQITLSDEELAVNSRLGLKWVSHCKSRQLGSPDEHVHKKPGEWVWFDELAKRPAKYGMKLEPNLNVGHASDFMKKENTQQCRTIRGSLRTEVLKMDEWKLFVEKVTEHYKDMVKYWCLQDETECSWTPDLYAPIADVSADTAHKAAPGVNIGLSCTPEFTEELFEQMDGEKLDFLGASAFDYHFWEGRHARRLKERMGKDWFCYGVGGRPPMHTMYHTVYGYRSPRGKAANMAKQVLNLFLVQDCDVPCHYAAVLRNDRGHQGKNKPLCDYDGTPLPWGATFGCLGTILADAEPLGAVPLGDTGRQAYLFILNGKIGAATHAACVNYYDHHFRPVDRELAGVTLDCDPGSVKVLDMYWNELPGVAAGKKDLRFDMNEEPVFIMDENLGEDKFRAMLAEVKTDPKPCDITFDLVPDGNDGLAMDVKVKNNTGSDLKNATVDLRFGRKTPMSGAAGWIFEKPFEKIGTVKAGAEKTVRFQTLLDGKVPFEDGWVVPILAADGFEQAGEGGLWMIPAETAKSPVEIDGKLDEWLDRDAAWLAYDWGWSHAGRHMSQFYRDAENFAYPPYRLDARARMWASYDSERLYVALDLMDNQPILSEKNGEKVELVIGSGDTTKTIELIPLPDGNVRVTINIGDSAGISAKSTVVERELLQGADCKPAVVKAIEMELSIPWKTLGMSPSRGDVVGFDMFWTDVDREGDEFTAATMRWAGHARDGGYMFMR